ncbi:IS1595 family transposase [Agromyces marinus]|uniref:IS1595 family transposase n=1 Tax=Agromyces marinus TaxID=1389020 RepID=A0ABM8GZI6_9MICO|nr:IS1595 family transposase [Agromyces marinus]UIP57901.1 IS1595 family transposase ISTesp4 [Agromyces marinus]BDZ53902.1 IS1595 family transposase [Agromyces marinus]
MAERPVGGVDYPRTYQELRDWFPDDAACLEYLAQLRWPDGFVCAECRGREFWLTGAGLRMCRACARRTSVTAGTIFHRTRMPLSTWFAAVWFVTSQKNGMSAQGLQRVLGLWSYETAWAWMHKLRRAMVRPDRDLLHGVVEVDETFVGGVSGGHLGASTGKATVMVAVEKPGPGRKLGRIRLGLADRPGTLGLVTFTQNTVVQGSTIHTDGARMMRRLADLGYTHEYATGYNAPDPTAVLPGVHLTASLLKRWLTGTLHYGVAEHQLPYYLDEFTYRFNRRDSTSRGLLFYRLLQQAVHTDPHPLRDLLDPESNPYLS